MVEAYQHVANHSIRNRGTLGGNLCHNDPAFEMPLVDRPARRDHAGAQRARLQRTIAAQRFFKAPFATDLAADEMLVEVRVPRMPSRPRLCFLEVSQRLGDRALIAAGCLLTIRYGDCREVRIGFRNAGHNVFRIPAAEAALEGKPASAAADRRGGRGGRQETSACRRPARRRDVSARRGRDPDPTDAARGVRARRPAARLNCRVIKQ